MAESNAQKLNSPSSSKRKMVLFGVEVDAPEGYDPGVNTVPLPKQHAAFAPILVGLLLIAAVVFGIFQWSAANDAHKHLEAKEKELGAAQAQITSLQMRVNDANEKVKALETEKATLTTDAEAKTAKITELEEQLAKKGKRR